ncbi:hypothetical protein VN23_04480 [Janthinobacterium sp. B9-8]|nr:hypothetical protein VN23_04480 [Janthinobacterium sp. B9-8]
MLVYFFSVSLNKYMHHDLFYSPAITHKGLPRHVQRKLLNVLNLPAFLPVDLHNVRWHINKKA